MVYFNCSLYVLGEVKFVVEMGLHLNQNETFNIIVFINNKNTVTGMEILIKNIIRIQEGKRKYNLISFITSKPFNIPYL